MFIRIGPISVYTYNNWDDDIHFEYFQLGIHHKLPHTTEDEDDDLMDLPEHIEFSFALIGFGITFNILFNESGPRFPIGTQSVGTR